MSGIIYNDSTVKYSDLERDYLGRIILLARKGWAVAKGILFPSPKDKPYQEGKEISYPSGKLIY